jgi:hypothetical protein
LNIQTAINHHQYFSCVHTANFVILCDGSLTIYHVGN